MDNESQIFIDGKSQIVEMLQMMPQEERSALIKNLRLKNPVLAGELQEKSISFEEALVYGRISDLFQFVTPSVLGMALKGINEEFQRRVLSAIGRGHAEEAYLAMVDPSHTEERVKRAREKVRSVIISLIE